MLTFSKCSGYFSEGSNIKTSVIYSVGRAGAEIHQGQRGIFFFKLQILK